MTTQVRVIPGVQVTFKHPAHNSVLKVRVLRVWGNGMLLCKTRNAMWAIPVLSILTVEND